MYSNYWKFYHAAKTAVLGFHHMACAMFFTFWFVCVAVDSARRGKVCWPKLRPSSVFRKIAVMAFFVYLFKDQIAGAMARSDQLIRETRYRQNFMASVVPGKRKMDANFFRSWHIWATGTFDFTASYLICAELYRGLYRVVFKRECTPRARLLFVVTFSGLCCFGLHRLDFIFHVTQCTCNYILVVLCQQLLPKREGKIVLWAYNLFCLWFIHTYGPPLVMPQLRSTGRRLYGWNGCGRFCVLKNISFGMDTLNASFKAMERKAATGADAAGSFSDDSGGGGGRAAHRRRRRQRLRLQRRIQQPEQQQGQLGPANSSGSGTSGTRIRKGNSIGSTADRALAGASASAGSTTAQDAQGVHTQCCGDRPPIPSVLEYFAYVFYIPLWIQGPILLYKDFSNTMHRKQWVGPVSVPLYTAFLGDSSHLGKYPYLNFNPRKDGPPVGEKICGMGPGKGVSVDPETSASMFWGYVKLAMYAVALNVANTYIYGSYLMQHQKVGVKMSPALTTFFLFFVATQHWFVMLVSWRALRLWALADGVEVTENMQRCPFTIFSFTTLWQHWHSSYHRWVANYVHLPLSEWGMHEVISVFLCFGFTGFWHGTR
jgi:hypothetical protein